MDADVLRGVDGGEGAGALLLCRAEPAAVRAAAQLLREPLLLSPAGNGWSVLVPEGERWRSGEGADPGRSDAGPGSGPEAGPGPVADSGAGAGVGAEAGQGPGSGAEGPGWAQLVERVVLGDRVEQVATGWATALAIGESWPVLALWWDRDRAGYALASGFRRTVGYVWLADGTPVGEDEAMRTFGERLGLDPVLDFQALEGLTRASASAAAQGGDGSGPGPGPGAGSGPGTGLGAGAEDGRGGAGAGGDVRDSGVDRLRELLAVLVRVGLVLPTGLVPGETIDRLRSVARERGAEEVEWPGWRDAVRAELEAVEGGRLGPYVRGPKARLLGAAQLGAGVPLVVWGLRNRGRGGGGWVVAGTVLLVNGGLGLAYDRVRG
ncbi:hypothetical protein [Streptomyces sp. NPDC050504]|uniref:hypothetical protein n=1 Tax=Streptomyces sp. NPDC050504 TaxID=3365618 RepID=UPI0037A066A4